MIPALGLLQIWPNDVRAMIAARIARNECGCLEWQRGRTAAGYGTFGWNRKHWLAHRVSYEIAFGPIPAGLYVCHKCDNPPCCNPDHLFLGTQRDNLRDAARKGRCSNGGKTIGEGHGRHKLTEAQVLEIRSRSTDPRKKLAEEFGISEPTIKAIRSGRLWKHVT